jgi:hypothetical protein
VPKKKKGKEKKRGGRVWERVVLADKKRDKRFKEMKRRGCGEQKE